MKNQHKGKVIFLISCIALSMLSIAAFCIFFDEAVIVRKETTYHVLTSDKLVALTFDDGPSLLWTPRILEKLKKAGIKATFFMLGEHVQRYPEIARQVSDQGHEIGNHTYDHRVLLSYGPDKLEKEIKDTEKIIREVTGQTTKYFRPPKAWLTNKEKEKIGELGYETILWSLNSKDWVTFHQKQIRGYILRHIRPGDIILFHDSGGVFNVEGGNREETVKTIFRLVEQLRERGYRFVTISELLKNRKANEKKN